LTATTSPSVAPSQKETIAFLAYWREQVSARDGLLRRGDVDALALRRILPNIWMYQRLDDGDYLCRLAGEAINRRWHGSIARRKLSEYCETSEYAVIRSRFDVVTARGLLAFGATRVHDGGWVVERIYGPLLDDDGRPRIILGCSAAIPWEAIQGSSGEALLIERMDFFDPISLAFATSEPAAT